MSGETNLGNILENLRPEVLADEFVFLTFNNVDFSSYLFLEPIAMIKEKEGLTVITSKQNATTYQHDVEHLFGCITLNVHSSLEAVGLTAAISSALAAANISANMIAGYYHDHVFVPIDDVKDALGIIRSLQHASKEC